MLKIIRTGTNKKAQNQTGNHLITFGYSECKRLIQLNLSIGILLFTITAVYTLVTGRVYTVGRRGSDLSFEDDTSISRKQAEIQVEHPLANVVSKRHRHGGPSTPSPSVVLSHSLHPDFVDWCSQTNPALPPSIIITDLGSKFGTYVNDGIDSKVKVSVREPQILGSSDRFRFGLQWNHYRIEYMPLLVTTSTMKNVSALKETIGALGAHLVSVWREDTDMLVMEAIVMTIKVVAALIAGKPIVTPEYFQDYLNAVKDSVELGGEHEPTLPNPRNYLPPLNERSLHGQDALFHPDPARREIFTGKYFLLADAKAIRNYKSLLECGGGEVELLTRVNVGKLNEPGTVIIGDELELKDIEDPKVKATIGKIYKFDRIKTANRFT